MAMNKHQKKQREETLQAVDAAAQSLIDKGVKLTLRAIADESGLSVGAVSKTPVKMYLFQKDRIGDKYSSDDAETKDLKAQITYLEEKVKKEHAYAVKANERYKQMKKDHDEWERKYRMLMMDYTLNIDKTIAPI